MRQWWAKGILLENCSCQLICPAHISFKQRCTYERCLSHWAFRIDEGTYDGIGLDGLNALIVTDSPQVMYDGGWKQAIYIDERANGPQRQALESILTGREGGPWAVLARFVESRLDTQFVSISIIDQERKRSARIEGIFETQMESIRGWDPSREAVLENLYNTIHGKTHVLSLGTTNYSDRGLKMATEKSHAIFSRFSWTGP